MLFILKFMLIILKSLGIYQLSFYLKKVLICIQFFCLSRLFSMETFIWKWFHKCIASRHKTNAWKVSKYNSKSKCLYSILMRKSASHKIYKMYCIENYTHKIWLKLKYSTICRFLWRVEILYMTFGFCWTSFLFIASIFVIYLFWF